MSELAASSLTVGGRGRRGYVARGFTGEGCLGW